MHMRNDYAFIITMNEYCYQHKYEYNHYASKITDEQKLSRHLLNIFTEHPLLWLALCHMLWGHTDEYEDLERDSSALKAE